MFGLSSDLACLCLLVGGLIAFLGWKGLNNPLPQSTGAYLPGGAVISMLGLLTGLSLAVYGLYTAVMIYLTPAASCVTPGAAPG